MAKRNVQLVQDSVNGLETSNGINVAQVTGAAVDNQLVRFNGTTGEIQGSGVIVDDSGNVGIGVTPSAWSTSYKNLQVGASGLMSEPSGTDSYNTTNAYYSSTGWKYINSRYATSFANVSGNFYWRTAPSGTAGDPITWNTAMTLANNGNLLVGTTTDNGVDTLQVNGSISAHRLKTDTVSEMYFDVSSGSTNKIQIKLSALPSTSKWYEFVINAYNFHLTSAKNIFLIYGFYTDGNTFTPAYSAMNDVLSNGFSVVAYTSADNKPCIEITRTDGLALLARGTIKQIGYSSSILVAQVNSTTRY